MYLIRLAFFAYLLASQQSVAALRPITQSGDNVQEQSTLVVARRRLGKKRKKKVYTTPKRIPHKHKKVKLAVLKFYKVDDDGKITRLRKELSQLPGAFVSDQNKYLVE